MKVSDDGGPASTDGQKTGKAAGKTKHHDASTTAAQKDNTKSDDAA